MATQELLSEFVEGIKEVYRERQLNTEEQWPPVRGDKLINLQLVEAAKEEGFRAGLPQHGAPNDNKVKHTLILHGDLFRVEESKKPVKKLRSSLKEILGLVKLHCVPCLLKGGQRTKS